MFGIYQTSHQTVFDTRSFYRARSGEARHESALTKNAWFGIHLFGRCFRRQAMNSAPQNRNCLGAEIPWDQMVSTITPTNSRWNPGKLSDHTHTLVYAQIKMDMYLGFWLSFFILKYWKMHLLLWVGVGNWTLSRTVMLNEQVNSIFTGCSVFLILLAQGGYRIHWLYLSADK